MINFLHKKVACKKIGIALSVAIVAWFFGFELLALLALAVVLVYGYLYRKTEFNFSFEKNDIIAPVDGIVSSIAITDDGMHQIVIESSLYDEASLRVPMSDVTVSSIKLFRGARLDRSSQLFDDLGEKLKVEFTHINGEKITLIHQLQRSIIPIELFVSEGSTVECKSTYGIAHNAITTLTLPKTVHLDLQVGEHILSAQTTIAKFH